MARPHRGAAWLLLCDGDPPGQPEPAPEGWTTLSNVVRDVILWAATPDGAARLKLLDDRRLKAEAKAKAAEAARREQAHQSAIRAATRERATELKRAREEAREEKRKAVAAAEHEKARQRGVLKAALERAREEAVKSGEPPPDEVEVWAAWEASWVKTEYVDPLGPLYAAVWAVLERCPSQALLRSDWETKTCPGLLTPPRDRHRGANSHVALIVGTVGRGTDDAAVSRERFGNLVGRPVLVRPDEVQKAYRALGINYRATGAAKAAAEKALREHLERHGKDRPKAQLKDLLSSDLSPSGWDEVCRKVAVDHPELSAHGRPRKNPTPENPE